MFRSAALIFPENYLIGSSMIKHSAKLTFGRYDYAGFFTFGIYASSSTVVPMVLTFLAKDLEFPLTEGGMGLAGALQIARSIPMTIMLLLSGFFTAKLGNRISLAIATGLMTLGIMVSGLAPNYWALLLFLTIAGLGEGIIEGLATPFIQEQHPDSPGQYINFTHSFWSVGVLATMIGAGALLSWGIHWRPIVFTAGLLGVIPVLLLSVKTGGKYGLPHSNTSFKPVLHNIWQLLKMPRFLLYFVMLFLIGGAEFCLTFWVASYMQIECKSSPWMAGIAAGTFALGMIVGRMGSGILVRQENLGKLVVGCALIGAILTTLFPLLSSAWVLILLLFPVGCAIAPFWPSTQSHCVAELKDADSTMIYILLSASGVPGCGFFSLLIGLLGDHVGLRLSFFVVPACLIAIAILMFYDMRHYKKQSKPYV